MLLRAKLLHCFGSLAGDEGNIIVCRWLSHRWHFSIICQQPADSVSARCGCIATHTCTWASHSACFHPWFGSLWYAIIAARFGHQLSMGSSRMHA